MRRINDLCSTNLLSAALNEKDVTGAMPLHIAAAVAENLSAVELLLDNGANINAQDHELRTPLSASIHFGKTDQLKIVTELINKGASIECRNRENYTPLMQASSRSLSHIAQRLLDAKADIHATNHLNCSALHTSAWGTDCRTFATLLHRGLDVHALDSFRCSAFHHAIFQPSFLSMLLNMDIELNEKEPIQWMRFRQFRLAALTNFLKLARRKYTKAALRNFVGNSSCNAWSPLCLAASAGFVVMMDNLLGIGADLDSDGCHLGSALMAACEYGRKSSVVFLTRRGAALSYSGPSGFRSAYTISQRFPDILSWLLVDRFVDQAKLSAVPYAADGLEDSDQNDASYTWRGPVKVELVITGAMERQPSESSKEYWIRLMQWKKHWRGNVVPLIPGRRTTRPNLVIPLEYVRIHPDGYEVKRDVE